MNLISLHLFSDSFLMKWLNRFKVTEIMSKTSWRVHLIGVDSMGFCKVRKKDWFTDSPMSGQGIITPDFFGKGRQLICTLWTLILLLQLRIEKWHMQISHRPGRIVNYIPLPPLLSPQLYCSQIHTQPLRCKQPHPHTHTLQTHITVTLVCFVYTHENPCHAMLQSLHRAEISPCVIYGRRLGHL